MAEQYLKETRCRWSISKRYGTAYLRTIDYLFGWNEAVVAPAEDPEHKGEFWYSVELVPPGKGCVERFTGYAKTLQEGIDEAKKYVRKDVVVVL